MSGKILKVLTYLVPIIGGSVGLLSEYVNYKNMEEMVKEEVAEQLSEINEDEEG